MFELIKKYILQFKDTILAHKEATFFIRDNKLWDGFWKYGWVSRMLIGLALLMGLKLWSVFFDWWNHTDASGPVQALASMGTLAKNVAFEGYDFLFVGGMKYVMLVLLEVIIFHICRKTLEILSGESSELTFNTFLNAQIRMIKVVIRSYIWEMIFTVLIKIVFGIFGSLDFLQPVFIFGVQCYFLGLVIVDNYNEQFGLTIKESFEFTKQFIGVAVAIGIVMNVLLLIPVLGAIAAPVIAAVAVTLVMYSISDLHLREEMISEA